MNSINTILQNTTTLFPTTISSALPSSPRVHQDELGKLIVASTLAYLESASWKEFVESQRALPDLPESIGKLNHPAKDLLKHLRVHGAPATMSTKPWLQPRRREAIRRGPHQSATEHVEFVRTEFVDFLQKKFWTILPYRLVEHVANLRLSPLGVIPQRERRPRLIVDLSFYGVNQETLPIAPKEAMQFGRTLQRVLQRILDADPRFGPVLLSKIDISDGFYRIRLSPRDIPNLAVLLPQYADEEPMVAFPLVLPMGWVHSPPYFSAVTETAADLMNRRLQQNTTEPYHRLEEEALAETEEVYTSPPTEVTTPVPDNPRHRPRYRKPLAYADVYVDDFIALLQGTPHRQRHAMRSLLHTLDVVFRPLEPEEEHRQEPASVKKLRKGDACWSTRKVILGWLIATLAGTIQLPSPRYERLCTLLDSIGPNQKRVSVKSWQKLLGELRSMTLAIPGARGLFSTLQHALKPSHTGKLSRVRITSDVRLFLDDFQRLASELASRPTRIAETLPRRPAIVGTTDASGHGMGGVAFLQTDTGPIIPLVWRSPFPTPIQKQLSSFENPKGAVTNSDLELAATIVHHDVLNRAADCREHTIRTYHDNTPAVFWQRKGSTSTSGPAAYLLRLQAHHQRHYRYVPSHGYLPGALNSMSDDASRLSTLTDAEFLTHFNETYPQPVPWQLHRPHQTTYSSVISALVKKPSDAEWLKAPSNEPTAIGKNGKPSASSRELIPTSPMSLMPYPISRSSPPAIDVDEVPPDSPFGLLQLPMPSGRWARAWPAWGPKTAVSTQKGIWTSACHECSKRTPAKIPLLTGSNRFRLA